MLGAGIDRCILCLMPSGIYFSSQSQSYNKYTSVGYKGTRLLLIAEVALGNIKVYSTMQPQLTGPPEGYHRFIFVTNSCFNPVSVCSTPGQDFLDTEYVIFDPSQKRLRYVVHNSTHQHCRYLVEYQLDSDLSFSPQKPFQTTNGFVSLKQGSRADEEIQGIDYLEMSSKKPKLDVGVIADDGPVPLTSVGVRGKIMDMVADIVLFQGYFNNSSSPKNAKYVCYCFGRC